MNLLDEILNGPLASELTPYLASGNDGAIAEALNQKTISVNGSISVNDFAMWCAATGLRAAIEDQSKIEGGLLRSTALTLLDLLRGNLQPSSLDLSNTGNITMLDMWVAAGVITPGHKNDLVGMSQKLISRAEQLGVYIDHQLVAQALRG